MALKYKIFLSVAFLATIFQAQSSPSVSERDLSSLINLLSQKSGRERPVVVIQTGSSKLNQKYTDTSNELDIYQQHYLPNLLLQQYKAKTPSHSRKRTTKSLIQLKQRDRQQHQLQKLRDDASLQQDDKDALRSPIIKKLLRISNRLQCDAKDDCEDKCRNRFKGKMVIKCKVQCESKYECDEEKDSCQEDCGTDSCGNDQECQMSTRGERLVNDENKCKRC